ncbi:TlpA family protein disulfide reductase [Lacimicrobium alkaliphilum]|uniref:Thioredoxin domain-containing protein n=1 Tax=Lacimicrobium alkaliphilum TaxID=1526571 RepID=A0A0U2JI87_9ALTE|nr:redoxin domain-containing protein [Lacimicrobium alkaliphilum]ALS97142.1 hypothetical protein AT746_01840 [Lacimicrobium alkaliphilum]
MKAKLWLLLLCGLVFVGIALYPRCAEANSDHLQQVVHDLNGKALVLSALTDNKPVYLKLWATWCKPCMQQMPHFQNVQQKFGDDIDVIAVNIDLNDSDEKIQQVREQFDLTMPVVKDSLGEVARDFQMRGTPYHLIFDRAGKLVHQGHEANESLDNKLSLLADGELDLNALSLPTQPLSEPKQPPRPLELLYFTATWCDWYLEERRPDMSQNCIEQQKQANALSQLYPDLAITGVLSHLWTNEEALDKYKRRHQVTFKLTIDEAGSHFFRHKIKRFPTYLMLVDGKPALRSQNAEDIRRFMQQQQSSAGH